MRYLPLLLVAASALSCGATSHAPACVTLDEARCIDSPRCTLVVAADESAGYACVAARTPCEDGFVQRDATAETCEARDGCRFEPAQCYCAPDVTCICGGGPPPQCVPSIE